VCRRWRRYPLIGIPAEKQLARQVEINQAHSTSTRSRQPTPCHRNLTPDLFSACNEGPGCSSRASGSRWMVAPEHLSFEGFQQTVCRQIGYEVDPVRMAAEERRISPLLQCLQQRKYCGSQLKHLRPVAARRNGNRYPRISRLHVFSVTMLQDCSDIVCAANQSYLTPPADPTWTSPGRVICRPFTSDLGTGKDSLTGKFASRGIR